MRTAFSASTGSILLAPESGIWYRAVETRFLSTALSTRQTRTTTSRFNGVPPGSSSYEILYLAENHLVALLEVEALMGSPVNPGSLVPQPHRSWTMLNVTVSLQRVADLTDLSTQEALQITAQELTGDWVGYLLRGPATTVKNPTGLAPTQELGAALYQVPSLEGFKSISSKAPYHQILAVFPEKLLPGSRVSWLNPLTGETEMIPASPALRAISVPLPRSREASSLTLGS